MQNAINNNTMMIQLTEISSAQNPRFKGWLKLLEAKGIKKRQEALFAGRKFLPEMFAQHAAHISGILLTDPAQLDELPVPASCPAFLLPKPLFAQLDIYGTKAPLLLVHAPAFPAWNRELVHGLTVFVPFQNPINLGTTIRSSAALGARVVLLEEAATPYLPKCLRASGPALFSADILQGPSLAELAELAHLPVFALALRGESIFSFAFPETMGLVAGPEGPGLEDIWPEKKRLTIPMRGRVESLNATVCMGMAMACRMACLEGRQSR